MPRILSLDRLRLMALLGVVFYHLTPAWVPGGYLGVNIFFSLAGFLTISYFFRKKIDSTQRFRIFVKLSLAKIKKLYPSLLITLFLSGLIVYVLFSGSLGDVKAPVISSIFSVNNYEQIISGGDYFANTGKLSPFTHLWAISMEMQVYFLFFALCSQIKELSKSKQGQRKLFLILLGISIASYLYSLILIFLDPNLSRIYYDTFARLYSFSLGALSALISYMARRLEKQEPNRKAIIGLSILTLLPFFIFKPGIFMFGIGFFLYSLITALLLYFLNELPNKEIPKIDRITQYFAERGYVIFLWHYPLITLLDKLFANRNVSFLIYFPLFFILCYLFSEGTFRFVRALRGTKILNLLSILIAVALLVAPYESLAGSNERAEVMKSVLENEKLIQERKQTLEAEQNQGPEKEAKKETQAKDADKDEEKAKNKEAGGDEKSEKTALNGFWNLDRKDEAKQDEKASAKDKAKDKKKPPKREMNEIELKAALNQSPTYETALSFLEETNQLHPDVAVSVEDFNRLHLKDFLLIGDSIASMSYHTLYAYMPSGIYDSNHSRQMDEAPAFLEDYVKTKPVPEYIFVQLGTNGGVDKSDLDKLRDIAPDSKFFLFSVVLPYKAEEDERNSVIYNYCEEHKGENVYLIDWFKHTKTLDIFFEDNIHPGEEGAKILAHLMMRGLLESQK